ncbi:hypothetical protein AAV99_11505 [Aurantiacibacter marinus]|uniref:TonB-dependent receptor-like beta-barrel domain-containing protein n=2 Tax=Aurantiacibacter marinus TaxID=874156 RepID=A0A0H0XMT6_9SPHN|nr:hypothetical protein AAV99_11505 [Aurantiacibacter marinus]
MLALQPFNAGAASAQDANPEPPTGPDPAQSEDDIDQIIVYGARLRGRIDSPQPPILELDEDDIAAYGAGSIAELIEALGPQVSSGRGRGGGFPVILVNGVRISNFRELRSYPPEAIERTEVFSEEVAQRFGYSADQRVVNIILKDNYSSQSVELEYGQPFDGGFSQQEVQGTYLRIDGPSRLNLNVEWDNSSLLTEGERGVIQADASIPDVATDPDPANFRSLVGDSSSVEATANWTTQLGETGNSISLNATYERNDSLRLQGLDTVELTDDTGESALRAFNVASPLAVDRQSNNYSAAASINAGVGDWQVTGTVDATITDSVNDTQLRLDTTSLVAAAAAGNLAIDADLGDFAEAGFDRSETNTYTVNALLTARGNPVYLPGGEMSVTAIAGYRANGIESTDTGNPGLITNLDRTRWQAGLNVGVPITSRDEDFGSALGDISLNFNAAVFEQSDFGTLFDWSAGVTWGVIEGLTLTATYINRDSSPSLSELGTAQIATPNVPVFDIANNETVLVTVITGGNPLLPAQSQSDWKFGINWQLPFIENSSLQIEYFDNHSDDVTQGFPVLTPAIEAAFPGRVERNAAGILTRLDERFVTFAEQDVERFQVGLNMSGQFAGGGETSGQSGPPGANSPSGRPSGPESGGPAARPGGGEGASEGRGEGGGRPGPEQMAQMREQFCTAEPDVVIARFDAALEAAANGEPAPLGPGGQPLAIPARMLERLTGEDGKIDPERFAALRERICSTDGAQMAGRPEGAGDGPPRGEGRPGGGDSQARGGNRGGGGGRGRGGRGFSPFGGGDGPPVGRWFANIQYTLELENTVLIAPNIPLLDLLDGDALSGGGQPRHSITWRSGAFYDGYGMLLFARYTGQSRINGSGLAGSTDLFFDDFATINIRTFVDLGQRDNLVAAIPFLKGSRIGFDIDNLFDSRQRVTDSSGATPLRYQPFLIDPRGRSFEIEFRKLF